MPVKASVKKAIIEAMRNDLDRATILFERLAVNGHTKAAGNDPTLLLQPDKRDTAQFIYFETAAKFEGFCRDAFMLEVRHRLDLMPKRAEFVMGTIDRGLEGVMGWADPKKLQDRAQHLFGKNVGMFARLTDLIGKDKYDRLIQAHIVRNRIAHSGTDKYRTLLNTLQVPRKSRKGTSPGRLLLDYPSGNANANDRWFHRFVACYRSVVDAFESGFKLR